MVQHYSRKSFEFKNTILKKLSLSVLLGIVVFIGILEYINPNIVKPFRYGVTRVVSPVIAGLSYPIIQLRDGVNSVVEAIDFIKTNKKLLDENTYLREKEQKRIALEQENYKLKKLLKYDNKDEVSFVTARLIGDSGGVSIRNILINKGLQSNISVGMGVVASSGLLGRILRVNEHQSRVLLLNHRDSYTPVFIEGSRENAILVGDGTNGVYLDFISNWDAIYVGGKVYTSGTGGMYPAGFLVGEISEIQDGRVSVSLLTHVSQVSYVRVVRYKNLRQPKRYKKRKK